MLLSCPNCQAGLDLPTALDRPQGRKVKCANCGFVWKTQPNAQAVPSFTPQPNEDNVKADFSQEAPNFGGDNPMPPANNEPPVNEPPINAPPVNEPPVNEAPVNEPSLPPAIEEGEIDFDVSMFRSNEEPVSPETEALPPINSHDNADDIPFPPLQNNQDGLAPLEAGNNPADFFSPQISDDNLDQLLNQEPIANDDLHHEKIVPMIRKGPIAAWLILTALIALLLYGLITAREDLMKDYPPLTNIFNAIGLGGHEFGYGLVIASPTTSFIIVPNQPRKLVLSGTVKNTADETSALSPLMGVFYNSRNEIIHQWFFRASKDILLPGEEVGYTSEVIDPPRGLTDIRIVLATEQEAQ